MSDIFREVEEDVRRERLLKFWKAYGDFVIAAIVLLFAALGAFVLWQRHEDSERDKASSALISAERISNPTQAADAFDTLAKSAPKGYALVSRLAEANAMYASGQTKNAIDLYKQIAKDDDGAVGSVARLRAAWAQSENATRGELAQLLAPLNQPGNAWRALAQEVLAYADYRALDLKAAQTKFQFLASDAGAPDALRARAHAMALFIKNGGAADFGTVPPPAPAALPGAAQPDVAAGPAPAQ